MIDHSVPARGSGSNSCGSADTSTARAFTFYHKGSQRSLPVAANDNPRRRLAVSSPVLQASDEVLAAALRHFADHGLGAARAARFNAKQAFFVGDRAAYDWWLSITQVLDRRLVSDMADNFTGRARLKGPFSPPTLQNAANSSSPFSDLPPEDAV